MANSHQNNHDKFSNSKIFYRVFVANNNFRVNYLSLLFELLIFWNFLEVFTHFNQLGMKFIYLRFFREFHKMRFIMSVKIKRNGFVFTICRCETDIGLKVSTDVSFAGWSCEHLSSASVMRYDFNRDIFGSLSSNLIWKFDDFSGFLFKFETKGSGGDTKVNGNDLAHEDGKRNHYEKGFHYRFKR